MRVRPPQFLSRRLWAVALAVLAFTACDRKVQKLETFTNSVGMTLLKIPAGSFSMGDDGGDYNEKPTHKVTISKAFWLGQTEVTQGQWKAVMGTTPWSGKDDVREGDDYPVVSVSWDDAQEFIQKLNTKGEGTYRLPTEAEWEYACRAGTSTKYSFGDDESGLREHAWFEKNANDAGEKYAHKVGTKRPNPWGLYDLHGNVWEWCQDCKRDYGSGTATDPTGPSSGFIREFRGGSWDFDADNCRSACRGGNSSDFRSNALGFRLLRTLP